MCSEQELGWTLGRRVLMWSVLLSAVVGVERAHIFTAGMWACVHGGGLKALENLP